LCRHGSLERPAAAAARILSPDDPSELAALARATRALAAHSDVAAIKAAVNDNFARRSDHVDMAARRVFVDARRRAAALRMELIEAEAILEQPGGV
jgi:hypothetical protein